MITLLYAILVPAGPVRSSAEISRAEVLPGEPLMIRFARENMGKVDLEAATGSGDPEWLQVSLLRDDSRTAVPLACTRLHTTLERVPGIDHAVASFGTSLPHHKTDLSYAGFLLPSTLPPGTYTAQISWAYSLGFSRDDHVATYVRHESGMRTLRVTVAPASEASLGIVASDLAERVWDGKWKGAPENGFAFAAAEALFSMAPKAAFGAWRRLATEPRRNTVNGIPHAYLPSFDVFAILFRREEPEAVEILSLLAKQEMTISPQTWDFKRDDYLQALRRMSQSQNFGVAVAAQKAYDVLEAKQNASPL